MNTYGPFLQSQQSKQKLCTNKYYTRLRQWFQDQQCTFSFQSKQRISAIAYTVSWQPDTFNSFWHIECNFFCIHFSADDEHVGKKHCTTSLIRVLCPKSFRSVSILTCWFSQACIVTPTDSNTLETELLKEFMVAPKIEVTSAPKACACRELTKILQELQRYRATVQEKSMTVIATAKLLEYVLASRGIAPDLTSKAHPLKCVIEWIQQSHQSNLPQSLLEQFEHCGLNWNSNRSWTLVHLVESTLSQRHSKRKLYWRLWEFNIQQQNCCTSDRYLFHP